MKEKKLKLPPGRHLLPCYCFTNMPLTHKMDLPVDRNFKLQVNLIYERHIYVYEVCFAREEMFECLNVFACRFTRLQLKVEMLHLDPICC